VEIRLLKKEIIKYTHLQDRALLLCLLVNEFQFNTLSLLVEAVEVDGIVAAAVALAVIVTVQLEN
tara:strand:- start:188 stop:382 length:195 start_codon:yes stop_codon:yes gene_type:complete